MKRKRKIENLEPHRHVNECRMQMNRLRINRTSTNVYNSVNSFCFPVYFNNILFTYFAFEIL